MKLVGVSSSDVNANVCPTIVFAPVLVNICPEPILLSTSDKSAKLKLPIDVTDPDDVA